MTINLTDLAAARAKMTPGEYRVVDETYTLVTSAAGEIVCDSYGSNAAGIVATHNAADVLIDVVRVALEWRDVESVDPDVVLCDVHYRRHASACNALLAALAKVSL